MGAKEKNMLGFVKLSSLQKMINNQTKVSFLIKKETVLMTYYVIASSPALC